MYLHCSLSLSLSLFLSLSLPPESVRLVDGPSVCSGRVEVKSNESWTTVCEGGFDQQDAQVVCRELGCGAPSVHQGALYGKVNTPMWAKEFQCEGTESVLLDCRTSNSSRNTSSSDKSVELTYSGKRQTIGLPFNLDNHCIMWVITCLFLLSGADHSDKWLCVHVNSASNFHCSQCKINDYDIMSYFIVGAAAKLIFNGYFVFTLLSLQSLTMSGWC